MLADNKMAALLFFMLFSPLLDFRKKRWPIQQDLQTCDLNVTMEAASRLQFLVAVLANNCFAKLGRVHLGSRCPTRQKLGVKVVFRTRFFKRFGQTRRIGEPSSKLENWVDFSCRIAASHSPLAHRTSNRVKVGVSETENNNLWKAPTSGRCGVFMKKIPATLSLEVV